MKQADTFVAYTSASGARFTALLVPLPTCFTLVSRLAYFWTLKTGTTYASETWVDFRPITRCYILEDRTLQKNLFSVLSVFCPLFLLYPSSSLKSIVFFHVAYHFHCLSVVSYNEGTFGTICRCPSEGEGKDVWSMLGSKWRVARWGRS